MINAVHPSETGPLYGQRVLVVDDVEEDRILLTDFLLQRGCRIYVAKDGQDGYRKAQSVQPDLILMDIRMPVCDGIAACRLLKANPGTRSIPLIFLSAAASTEEKIAGLAVGAVDYVTKPFDFEEVRLRLCVHLKATRRKPGNRMPATMPRAMLLPRRSMWFCFMPRAACCWRNSMKPEPDRAGIGGGYQRPAPEYGVQGIAPA